MMKIVRSEGLTSRTAPSGFWKIEVTLFAAAVTFR